MVGDLFGSKNVNSVLSSFKKTIKDLRLVEQGFALSGDAKVKKSNILAGEAMDDKRESKKAGSVATRFESLIGEFDIDLPESED
jgi:hypothetical protein